MSIVPNRDRNSGRKQNRKATSYEAGKGIGLSNKCGRTCNKQE